MKNIPFRWIVAGVFMISSALNYLDRQILAAVSPLIIAEFHLNNQGYGWILSVFSITFAISSPIAGLVLDRCGLTRGISAAVALWSAAGIGTGLASSLGGLLTARAILGIGESAGLPSTGKLTHKYLQPKERSLGAALSNIGLSVGAVTAPWMANLLVPRYGWRMVFVVAGVLGFLWIPLWWWMDRRAEKMPEAAESSFLPVREILRDRQMWGFLAANVCSMTVYTLWTNWTTIFFSTHYGLSPVEANKLAPLPHFFAYFGGITGGAISYRLIAKGMAPLSARRKALLICAALMTTTVIVPWMPTPLSAALVVSFSFFWATGWGVSLYTMPVDAYGKRAGFAISLLTMAYGILQIFVSPLIGGAIDHYGFRPVCLAAGLAPLLGYVIVSNTSREA